MRKIKRRRFQPKAAGPTDEIKKSKHNTPTNLDDVGGDYRTRIVWDMKSNKSVSSIEHWKLLNTGRLAQLVRASY